MKKILLLASAFLAAVACSREPVAPEEPVTEQVGPIQVTLVTGEPETRTELGYAGNKLKPFWSTDDNINIIRIPNSDESEEYEMDEYEDYVFHLFESGLTQSDLSAVFTGEVDNGGQYRAFYPDRVEGVDRWGDPVIDGPMLDEEFNALRFTIPTVQYPSSTSFDKRADLLVSAPFEIPNSGSNTLGAAASDIPISFTRPNAIVKVVFNVSGSLRNKLENQKVRKVSFNSFGGGMGPEGGEMMMSVPQTRAFVLDNDDIKVGLTGDVLYGIPYVTSLGTYNCNEDGYQLMGSNSSVFAEYTDETAFDILDSDAAVYFIVYPSILKNVEDEGSFNGGLPIRIETDGYVITRDVRLPSSGIALQPSVVTTLKINLTEDNLIEFEKKGISIDQEEMVLMPGDGRFVDIGPMGMYFPRDVIYDNDDFQEYFAVSPADFSLRYVEYGEIDDCSSYAGAECISHLYLSADENVTPGEHEVTITYDGKYSTTCKVTVITSSDPIHFDDAAVEAICVEAWGSNGVLTEYQASKVTSLQNPEDYKSYFYHNTEITSFNELQFFTGLTSIDQSAFDSCTSLESVKLPKCLHMIDYGYSGSGAFRNCANLVSVDFTDCTDLEGIGSYAFSGCTSLTSITLPASVSFISGYAFYSCQGLTTVAIPDNSQLYAIYEHAFDYCLNLSTIVLPSSLKTIGEEAFSDCRALTSINIPEGLTSIYEYAFYNCASLETVQVQGQGHFSIGEGAFEYSGLKNIDNLLLHATSCGSKAFDHSAVQFVEIPSTMTEIPSSFLSYCYNLETVTFSAPSHVTTINNSAFRDCSSLKSIELPSSLAIINSNVFDGVTFRSGNGQSGVKFNGSTPPTTVQSVINGEHWDGSDWVSGVEIRVPSGSESAYSANANILNTNNIIVGF